MSSDYQLEDTIFLPFTTRAFATGIPTVLAGTPAIDIYEDVTATPIITGETLAVSLNSVAGFNMITITATAGTGFGAGQSYTAVIESGTVGGVSVVGEVVAHFTLDMSAAAKDLANGTDGLGALKTVVDAIPTTAMRGTDSAALASVVGALADAAVDGNPTTGDTLMQYIKQLINVLVGSAGVTTFPSAAAPANNVSLAEIIRAIYDDTVVIGTAGAGLTDLGGMSTGMKGEVNAEADTANTDYGANTTVPDAAGTAPTLAEIQTTALTESYAANGSTPTQNQLLYAVHQMLMEFVISGTSYTVKKLDSSTTAFVVTLDDATSPTSNTR